MIIRPFQLDCAHHRLDAAVDRGAGRQEGLTRRTASGLTALCALIGMMENRLGQAARALLT